MSKESKPFLQLIQSFSPDASLTSTDALNHNIRTIRSLHKSNRATSLHWQTQTQQQSKMQCYLSLNREYSMAEYLFTVSDKKLRSTLTRYRLSGHKLMIETGRHRQHGCPQSRDCVHTVTWIGWKQNCTSWQSVPNTQIYGQCTTTKYSRSIPHLQLFQTRRN